MKDFLLIETVEQTQGSLLQAYRLLISRRLEVSIRDSNVDHWLSDFEMGESPLSGTDAGQNTPLFHLLFYVVLCALYFQMSVTSAKILISLSIVGGFEKRYAEMLLRKLMYVKISEQCKSSDETA